jgi:hypothetical protein
MIDDKLTGKDLEGSDSGSIDTSLGIYLTRLRKTMKTSGHPS